MVDVINDVAGQDEEERHARVAEAEEAAERRAAFRLCQFDDVRSVEEGDEQGGDAAGRFDGQEFVRPDGGDGMLWLCGIGPGA